MHRILVVMKSFLAEGTFTLLASLLPPTLFVLVDVSTPRMCFTISAAGYKDDTLKPTITHTVTLTGLNVNVCGRKPQYLEGRRAATELCDFNDNGIVDGIRDLANKTGMCC